MRFVSKFFENLTTRKLYGILKARSAVFVMEQNCVCRDIDGPDPDRVLYVNACEN